MGSIFVRQESFLSRINTQREATLRQSYKLWSRRSNPPGLNMPPSLPFIRDLRPCCSDFPGSRWPSLAGPNRWWIVLPSRQRRGRQLSCNLIERLKKKYKAYEKYEVPCCYKWQVGNETGNDGRRRRGKSECLSAYRSGFAPWCSKGLRAPFVCPPIMRPKWY